MNDRPGGAVPFVPHPLSFEGIRQLMMRILFRVLAGISSDIRLAEAFAAGKPIREYASKGRGAQDYAALAETLLPALTGAGQAMSATPA